MPPATSTTDEVVSDQDLAAAILKAGFSQDGGLFDVNDGGAVTIMAIALAEHSGQVHRTATLDNVPLGGKGVDRGPFQINSFWHPEVTDRCAFSVECSARAAYRISGSGTTFSAWTTYKSGKYRAYLDRAKTAIAGWIAVDPGELKTGTGPLDEIIGVGGKVKDAAATIADLIELLTSGETWVRVGEVVLGGILVGVGVWYAGKT